MQTGTGAITITDVLILCSFRLARAVRTALCGGPILSPSAPGSRIAEHRQKTPPTKPLADDVGGQGKEVSA
jgi:hypothetical protein